MAMSNPDQNRPSPSPRWGSTTKIIIGLSLSAILVTMVISIRSFLGPVILAFILAYLVFPLTERLKRLIRLPWRLVSSIVYLVVFFVFLGVLTWGGITLVEQVQNLIRFLQGAIDGLPGLIDQLTKTPLAIGPFLLDLKNVDLMAII